MFVVLTMRITGLPSATVRQGGMLQPCRVGLGGVELASMAPGFRHHMLGQDVRFYKWDARRLELQRYAAHRAEARRSLKRLGRGWCCHTSEKLLHFSHLAAQDGSVGCDVNIEPKAAARHKAQRDALFTRRAVS